VSTEPKRIALRVALAVASVCLVLVLGEGVASVLGSRSSFRGLHVVRPGAAWLYELEPNEVVRGDGGVRYEINANGFRDVERSVPKPTDVFRIAVLGDSVAFGYGVEVEAGFVARTETALSAHAADGPAHIEVLNFAVSGYNPYNEAALYRGVVRSYEPDLVLVQFCINDLNDPTLHFGASTMQHLGPLPDLAFPNPDAPRRSAREVSWLALTCERSELCALLFGDILAGSRGPSSTDDWRTGFAVREGPDFEVEWEWLRTRYTDIAASASADGATFGILAFPYETEAKPKGESKIAREERTSATRALVELGEREGWHVIDLLPAFRSSDAAGADLFQDPWHPTAAGHELAAHAIARALRCSGLVPADAPPDCG
jgi:lysophospholipase L1-like esterase